MLLYRDKIFIFAMSPLLLALYTLSLFSMENPLSDIKVRNRVYVLLKDSSHHYTLDIDNTATVKGLKKRMGNQIIRSKVGGYLKIPASCQTIRVLSSFGKNTRMRSSSLNDKQLLTTCVYAYDTNVFELDLEYHGKNRKSYEGTAHYSISRDEKIS